MCIVVFQYLVLSLNLVVCLLHAGLTHLSLIHLLCFQLIIESDRTRERNLNLADCFDKLRSTIYDVEKSLNSRVETEEDAAIIRKVCS